MEDSDIMTGFMLGTDVILMVAALIHILFITLATVSGEKLGRYLDSNPVPTFNPTETNYTYHKGERAILYCSVQNLGTKTENMLNMLSEYQQVDKFIGILRATVVIWRRKGEKAPLTIGTYVYTSNGSFDVAHTEGSTDWNLMIRDVQLNHSGTYECQISATDRHLRKDFNLKVKDERSYARPSIRIGGKTHVDKGQKLSLMCNATGTTHPPDDIDWFKDGIKITASDKKLLQIRKRYSISTRTITSNFTKKHAQMSDTGTYVCRTSSLQVTSVKVNVLNTDKELNARDILDESEDTDKRQKYTEPANRGHREEIVLSNLFSILLTSQVFSQLSLGIR